MWVKICGMCSEQDAQAAAAAGADAVGLNFVSGPRKIPPDRAAAIVRTLPPSVTPVALVRLTGDTVSAETREFLGANRVSWLQVYGQVTPQAVAVLQRQGFQVITVYHILDASFAARAQAEIDECRPAAVMLDAASGSAAGGGGQPFDWTLVRKAREAGELNGWPPLILAGGLTARNVAAAVSAVAPWAVDVCSGVESAPGRKDAAKMHAFVQAVRQL